MQNSMQASDTHAQKKGYFSSYFPSQESLSNRKKFIDTQEQNWHFKRAASILKKHPEIKKFMKPYYPTAIYILAIVGAQIFIASLLANSSIWIVLITAFILGAPVSHALFCLMHDASHNLVFRSKIHNKLIAILTNIGQGLPNATAFQKFHIMHHTHLDEHILDSDPPLLIEATIVKGSPIRKMVWLLFLGLIQAIRPTVKKAKPIMDKWFAFNCAVVLCSNLLIVFFLGWESLIYIIGSTIFGLGIHPIGARWIQEHYTFKIDQQTYSYYGIGNLIGFNIGYHNEHHDLINIPWIHLPKVKKIASEFYTSLYSHKSWLLLYIYFIFNPKYTLFNRFKVTPELVSSK